MCLFFCAFVARPLTNGSFDTNVDDRPVGMESTILRDPLVADDGPDSGSVLDTASNDPTTFLSQ